MKNPVGRPIKDDAVTRTGVCLRSWITSAEGKFLDDEAKRLNVSRTMMLRIFIQNAMKKNQ